MLHLNRQWLQTVDTASGRLKPKDMSNDIKKIEITQPNSSSIDLIVAVFPCQGFDQGRTVSQLEQGGRLKHRERVEGGRWMRIDTISLCLSSLMGKQQGYDHAGSGLYTHILRLID